MPAVTPADVLSLPRVHETNPLAIYRNTRRIVPATRQVEGEGFVVRRPFPGRLSLRDVDPFLLLDQMGSVDLAPGEAKGTPWHPHRGFETVTYMIDGALEHKDSTGGGGLITNGGTQWMTAGAGILHIEQPDEQLVMKGGVMHGVQLWVNLPAHAKMTAAKYQDIEPGDVKVVTNLNGDAVIRIIAGNLGEHEGPGMTFTPITYAHITLMPGARVALPWRTDFSAMVYALNGRGAVGADNAPLTEAELAILDDGDTVVITAADKQDSRAGNFDVLVLGGLPIREPISHYGPFVMNTREQIIEAMEDFQSGRMGHIPPAHR